MGSQRVQGLGTARSSQGQVHGFPGNAQVESKLWGPSICLSNSGIEEDFQSPCLLHQDEIRPSSFPNFCLSPHLLPLLP